ncbi:triose-phosphate isomerase [Christensenella massiliensis]|uniref:Triose-phosphate isomerase n=1 Tax=Christensenella massiliensis TaxID=1805714 RepID=A0AAU8A5A4_9FIRM
MLKNFPLKPPFFEIGPKSYLVGDEILELALAADIAAEKYGIDIIFTTPVVDIRRVAQAVKHLFVFAPHMEPIEPGRGLADILPESLVAAGAHGVMLNHCEKPLSFSVLAKTIRRAEEVGLATIVCADSIAEASAVAHLSPDIIVAEPTELIGTGNPSDMSYVQASIEAVKKIDSDILVLQGAGISCGEDVYRVIGTGAEATGSSSGIVKAPDRAKMIDEMIGAVRRAWDERRK